MAKIWDYKEEEVKAAAEMVEQHVEFVSICSTIYARFPNVSTWGEYTELRHALAAKLGADPRENLKWESPNLPGLIFEVGRDTRGSSPLDPIPLDAGQFNNPWIKEAQEEWALRAKDLKDVEGLSGIVFCDRISFCYDCMWYVIFPSVQDKIFLTRKDKNSIVHILQMAGCNNIVFETEF